MPPMARAKGTGSIVPDKPTPTGLKRWRVAVTMADGRRVYRRASSPKEAERIRRQLVEARELDLDPTRQTVGEYLRSWIVGLRSPRHQRVRDSTLAHYERVVERIIIPVLGDRKLAALNPRHVQAWVDGLDAAPTSVRHYHGVLSIALGRAVRQRLIVWNPANGIELPRPPRRSKANPFTLNEAKQLLAATEDTRYGSLWRLAIVTGMRSGELLGLTWDAVGDGYVDVVAQLQRVPPARGGDRNGWALTPTKTDRDVKRVAIDPVTIEALEAHRRRMASERTPDWEYHGLVFLTPEGMPLHRDRLLNELAAACALAGLARRRTHDLRYTNLHLLNDQGAPEDVRMQRAGHGTRQMARKYAGASAVQDRLVADALGRAIEGAS